MQVSSLPVSVPKSLLITQIVTVFLMIECALWTHGRTQMYWFAASFATLGLFVLISSPKVRDLGMGSKGLLNACRAIPVALLFSGLAIAIASFLGTLRGLYGELPVSGHALFYTIWAFEQQFILNSFFYKRFESLLGNNTEAMVVTALLFSLVHLPNPVLVPATFLGGLFFVSLFRRWRNIYPLGIAHAIMGLTLAITFPDSWIRHMKVGIGYFHFHLG